MTAFAFFHKSKVVPVVFLLAIIVWACQESTPPFQCHDSLGCVRVAPDEPLKIGILQALTGEVASIGQGQTRGIELALEAHEGKVAGHSVVFQTEDTGCSEEGGANAVLKILADPDNIAILGTTCSGAAAAVSKAMSEAGLTMISGNNSAPFLTRIADQRGPCWQPGYFRTAPNEENAGKAAAIFAFKTLGVVKAAAINDGDIYTRGLTDSFVTMFQELGGKVVLDTSVNKGDRRMQPVLTAIQDARAEFLFFPLFQPEGNYLLLQAREMPGFENIRLMTGGALINVDFLESVGEKAKGLYFVGPSAPSSPATEALDQRYIKKYNAPPDTFYYLTAYDAASLLFKVIEKTAVHDPTSGALFIGRRALRDALYETRHFNGVSGTLACDAFGDCAQPVFKVLRMDAPLSGIQGLLDNVQFSYAPVRQELTNEPL